MWWTYALLFLADDFAYYWFHRIHHEVRVFWASHVVHHSSEHYNLSTALRQTWTPMTALPFWAPLALLGFPPWMILTQQAISLIYQFWIHTERVKKMPAWFEFFFNTPSHHRVHHGSNEVYLDRNYGGILIVWDRLFGSFQGETERVRYGLTKNIRSFRPTKGCLPRVRGDLARRAGRQELAPPPRLPLPRPGLVAGGQRRRHAGMSVDFCVHTDA
jgi:sterol desaturase/sphingolipid hydroxylase (fatty acid hydroxylase superfamily)